MADLYPLPSEDHLRSLYVEKSLEEIPTPAAIIDQAKARHNCDLLLDAVSHHPCVVVSDAWRGMLLTNARLKPWVLAFELM